MDVLDDDRHWAVRNCRRANNGSGQVHTDQGPLIAGQLQPPAIAAVCLQYSHSGGRMLGDQTSSAFFYGTPPAGPDNEGVGYGDLVLSCLNVRVKALLTVRHSLTAVGDHGLTTSVFVVAP